MLAQRAIKSILTDSNQVHGWEIPDYVVEYQAGILASRMNQPDWRPKPSYAERYFSLRDSKALLEFANTCYFTRSVFPELGHRHGITSSYYVDLGQSAYDRVISMASIPSPVLTVMRDHFEFLAETALTALRYSGDFRSMWD